jgi:zinc transporter, ZIP family
MDLSSPLVLGIGAGLVAGAATLAGAVPALLSARPSCRSQAVTAALAAGAMLAVTIVSLLGPALTESRARLGSSGAAVSLVVAAGLLGAAGVWSLDRSVVRRLPGHLRSGPGARAALLAAAVAVHNLPEGLAVGVGFATGDIAAGSALTAGIALHNLPEGFAVAAVAVAAGLGRRRALLLVAGAAALEPLGALVGAVAVSLASGILPVALALAAGAMLLVIGRDLLPAARVATRPLDAGLALGTGFTVLAFVAVVLPG